MESGKVTNDENLSKIDVAGNDTLGKRYENINDMWTKASTNKDDWYSKGVEYYDKAEVSDDGVLGGYGSISGVDLKISGVFMDKMREEHGMGDARVLECGAGIGRISKGLLIPRFNAIDLIEPC